MTAMTISQFESEFYSNKGRILVLVYSQRFPIHPYGSASDSNKKKKTKVGNPSIGREDDIDALALDKFFGTEFPAGKVDFKLKTDLKFQETLEHIKEMVEKENRQYDVFFFVFLTFVEEGPAQRLQFNEESLEEGLQPLEKILNHVKNLKATHGKPKIFLVQSDDMSLIPKPKEKKKAVPIPEEAEEIVLTRKIPTDADRLIIQSTIPQKFAEELEKQESFLIRAFIDTMTDNHRNTRSTYADLLSLTPLINGIVKQKVDKCRTKYPEADLRLPLTTSTLTKQLLWRRLD